ncbi:MAG TPA: phosphatase PAP2 family protein [Gemmatimonadales bacterium]|nr:phosphatase PAP2 family protein [Gemmatimonadales bacterium]
MREEPIEEPIPSEQAWLDGDLVRRPRTAVTVSLVMLGVVVLLTAFVALDVARPPFLQGIDEAWRRRMLAWPQVARRIGEVFEQAGAGIVMVPVRLVVAAWLVVRRRRWDLAAWLLGWALADLLTTVMKPGLARERPTATDPDNPFTSFPSAHAKTAAQVAVGLVLVATSPWRPRRAWYGLAVAWIVAMALSRTVVDHHWLSDVVAGSLLGAGAAVLAAAIVRVVRDRGAGTPARGPRDS